MATLYRKYRPQNFAQIVGQNHIKVTLKHEIETGQLAQAYLFAGPRGTGKTTMARILAKAVNCLNRSNGEVEPCNKCDSCLAISNGQSLAMVEIDAASHTGVDNVRENIISNARIAPAQNKYKVFIIDEVHMLSISAFNALLKIIEEPPAQVIFILCTTEVHKVPTTIISRCQRFDFKKISLNDIVAKLERICAAENIKADKEVLFEIARQSEGHLRDAESLLGQIAAIAGGNITAKDAALIIPRSDIQGVIKLLEYLGKKDAAKAIRLINEMVEGGVDLKIFTENLIETARKMILIQTDISLADQFSWEWGEAIESRIRAVNKLFVLDDLAAVIQEFSQALIKLKNAFIVQLPLEMAIISLTAAKPKRAPQPASAGGQTQPAVEASQPANSLPQPAPEAKAVVDQSVDLGAIANRWEEVLAKVTKYNHSLALILRVCQPQKLEGNILYLAFKYKFHKDRVDDPQIKVLIEKALAEVFGPGLKIKAGVDETLAVNNGAKAQPGQPAADQPQADGGQEAKEMIDNLLKTFGGRIVE